MSPAFANDSKYRQLCDQKVHVHNLFILASVTCFNQLVLTRGFRSRLFSKKCRVVYTARLRKERVYTKICFIENFELINVFENF